MVSNKSASSIVFHKLISQNLLSFGPQSEGIELLSLNVLVGANGVGKSNLIDIFALIRSTVKDIQDVIFMGGGVSEWIWKGRPDELARLAVVVSPLLEDSRPLVHTIAFQAGNQGFRFFDERIEDEPSNNSNSTVYYDYTENHTFTLGVKKTLILSELKSNESILVQRRDPQTFPEITHLASVYEKIRIYREWQFGRSTVFRIPQRADLRNDYLQEDFSNLGMVLNRLRQNPRAKAAILKNLRDLYGGLDDFDVSVVGGTVQVFFTEGDFSIPATRLSDGTLRYLCLLAILCDPNPAPLICIEEPELGLHPDILPKLADLLIEASERTQLIVTTHSDILIDALTKMPEAVIICEKHAGQTEMRRLNAADLTEWLAKYRLGQLWLRGELGGTRW